MFVKSVLRDLSHLMGTRWCCVGNCRVANFPVWTPQKKNMAAIAGRFQMGELDAPCYLFATRIISPLKVQNQEWRRIRPLQQVYSSCNSKAKTFRMFINSMRALKLLLM